jgi:hypothetical protein
MNETTIWAIRLRSSKSDQALVPKTNVVSERTSVYVGEGATVEEADADPEAAGAAEADADAEADGAAEAEADADPAGGSAGEGAGASSVRT